MDEMKIESKFTAGIVSKLVERAVHKKFGYDVDVTLNKFRTTIIDGKTHLHLDLDMELEKEELDRLLESIGL